ncbi:MAG: hypothetical protein AAB131_03720 [Actinomycetota bacterium]|jgi:hypothetical protein|nr:MAG: hypothetical protein FD127_3893 [Acidimicrobiaceae bacterium]
MRNETSRSAPGIDWAASLKLACVFSLFAATAAMLLAGYVAETTIVVLVIVAGTMASWYQLEHPVTTHPARVRHH